MAHHCAVILSLAFAALALPQPQPLPPPLPAAADTPYAGTIAVQADARDVTHRIVHVRETLPVAAGPLTLLYPEWVPGSHSPINGADHLAGLTITANGHALAWRRDPVAVHAFHLTVPAGVAALDIGFDVLTPTDPRQGRVTIDDAIAHLQWQGLVLYPAGHFARDITVAPTVTLPVGWQLGSALDVAAASGQTTRFRPVDLETLVDSPVFAGRWFRRVLIDQGQQPVALDLVAEREDALAVTEPQLAGLRALLGETDALFGPPRHFDHYDFLVALSGQIGGIGREHHRSTEIVLREDFFSGWGKTAAGRATLAHEYVHSWNGKYRQGADSWTADFNTPIRNSLLWVYEGQTQYWGIVLSARAGLTTAEEARDALAQTAAAVAGSSGRAWRPLADTVDNPQLAQRRPEPWADWQRGEDYYGEGALIWLDADTLIRDRSGGTRSLDDVAKLLFGGGPAGAATVTYTRADVVAALTAMLPYDWDGFVTARLDTVAAAPLDGLARGGYRLGFAPVQSETARAADAAAGRTDLGWSLGLVIDNKDATLSAVRWDSPAFRAGLIAGTQLIAVGGLPYTPDLLIAAVRTAAGNGPPVTILVKSGGIIGTVTIAWHGGLRYPRLERVPGTPARLDDVMRPRLTH